MSETKTVWEPREVNLDTVTENGQSIRILGAPAYRRKGTNEVYIDPEAALRTYIRQIAVEAGLDHDRDVAMLSLLGAPAGKLPVKFVQYKYTLNKMLFYQWARLAKQGLGDAFPHDEFLPERKGPVPKNIDADLDRLEGAGLIKVRKATGKEHRPWIIELTPRGRVTAEAVLSKTDAWLRATTLKVKEDLFALTPEKLKARVHSEFPKLVREYVEVDES